MHLRLIMHIVGYNSGDPSIGYDALDSTEANQNNNNEGRLPHRPYSFDTDTESDDDMTEFKANS